jgi:hypothetical protein
MIFWDVAAIETGSEDVRNRNEILKIDMIDGHEIVRSGTAGRICKNMRR